MNDNMDMLYEPYKEICKECGMEVIIVGDIQYGHSDLCSESE